MEGTRNERVAIIATSYVIGFVTAFILFGINNPTDTATTNLANVAEVSAADVYKEPKLTPIPIAITYENGSLIIKKGDKDIILTQNPILATTLIKPETRLHYNNLSWTLSDNNSYLFFCEQQNTEGNYCIGAIYDISNETVHTLTTDGVNLSLSLPASTLIRWKQESLDITGFTSSDPAKPWILQSN
ncbi:MAG: hypothetical protein H6779_00190 [Candidatus Nomurabacteria bacterium]|nr:MAG: hypothetical protein H6779_00190 [Candidatus Nomurabacteria bacterium]